MNEKTTRKGGDSALSLAQGPSPLSTLFVERVCVIREREESHHRCFFWKQREREVERQRVVFHLGFLFFSLSPSFSTLSLSPPLPPYYRPPFRAQSSTALCKSPSAKLGMASSSETVALPPPSLSGTLAKNSSTAAGESASLPWLAARGPSSPARIPERGAPLTFTSLR